MKRQQSMVLSFALLVIVMAQTVCVAQQLTADAFFKTLRQAQGKSQASDWKSAAQLWQQVVTLNPNISWAWYSLGTAQFNSGEYNKAAAAFEEALELGAGRLSTIAFDIARSHAKLKEKELTLKWLGRALELGFRFRERIGGNEAFAFLRDDLRFKAFAGEIDTTRMSRTEGWRYDLAFLETEIKRLHYRPFHKVSQAEFESVLQQLRAAIPHLTENQIIVRIMRLMSLIGDGHTALYPDLNTAWTTVPLQFELFQDGLYIIAANANYGDLVGSRVLRFGTLTPEQLLAAISPVISRDSEKGVTRSFNDFIRYPKILNGLGLQPESDRIVLTLRYGDEPTREVIVAAAQQDPEYNRITAHPKWVMAYQMSPGPLPTYFKDRTAPYWFELLPGESKTLYFQFNLVENSQKESLNQFLERLFKFIDQNDVEKLIIDLRWNNGGNTFLLPPLINGLISRGRLNQNGKLFVIVGRYTFSAAINAAASLEQNTNAILVGEPTPTGPNFIGESNIVTLPYSKVRVSISDMYWQNTWSTDSRTFLAPLLLAVPTFENYKMKSDPAMELILGYHGPTDSTQ